MLLSKFVDALIRCEIREDKEEIVDNVIFLVLAALDTTSYAITMMFKMLADHPHCYSLLLKGSLTKTILTQLFYIQEYLRVTNTAFIHVYDVNELAEHEDSARKNR